MIFKMIQTKTHMKFLWFTNNQIANDKVFHEGLFTCFALQTVQNVYTEYQFDRKSFCMTLFQTGLGKIVS